MKLTVKEMSLVSMFAALACAGGLMIRFGGNSLVPFSILPFITLLAGVLLGGRLGALSMAVYLAIGLAGAPVFGYAPYGGVAYLIKPSAGFLFGFIGGAYVTGKTVQKLGRNAVWSHLLASCAGLAALYAIGLPYLYIVLNFFIGTAINVADVLKIGFLPFIAFDLLKAWAVSVIAVPILKQVR